MTAVADTPQHRRALRSTAKVLPEHARASNRSMVLQLLFHAGPRSRAELARATGLTRVTISDLVSSLLAQGLVTELGQQADGKVGKPGTLVGQDAEAFQIVAVDLADDERVHGAVLDLSGAVQETRTAVVGGRTGAAAVEVLRGLCRELVAATTRPVLGGGRGVPGRHRPLRPRAAGPQPRLVRPAARRTAERRAAAAVLATLRERTIPVVSSHVQLRMTSLGEHGALSGAAVLVLSGQLGVT